jgi:hypothetical protein
LQKQDNKFDTLCPLGKEESVSLDHLFITCNLARAVWFNPCSIPLWIVPFYVFNFISQVYLLITPNFIWKDRFHGATGHSYRLWRIWTFKNKAAIEDSEINAVTVLDYSKKMEQLL